MANVGYTDAGEDNHNIITGTRFLKILSKVPRGRALVTEVPLRRGKTKDSKASSFSSSSSSFPRELDPMHDRCIFEPASRIASDALSAKNIGHGWLNFSNLQLAKRLIRTLKSSRHHFSVNFSLSLSLFSSVASKNTTFLYFYKKRNDSVDNLPYHGKLYIW